MALGKHAYHKPGDTVFDANGAVDGNERTNIPQQCSHTVGAVDNPWWKVDLGKNFYVTSVSIKNRGDCCG